MKWERVELGEIANKVTKGTTPTSIGGTYSNSGVPFLRAQNINQEQILLKDLLYIDERTNEMLKRSQIADGDVLLTIAGTIGRTAVVPKGSSQMNCNQAVAIIRPQKGIDPYYLSYWLTSDQAISQINGSKVTATISNLSLSQIKSLQIPLPPLSEQRRLAARLDKADAVRQKSRALVEANAELGRSVFLEVFGDPVRNERGWEVVELGEISDISSGSTPSRSNPDYWENGTIPWVKTGEVRGTEINETEEKITNKGLEESSCKLYPKGSIIIAMYGQGKTRGRVGKLGIEATTNQACAVIMPKNKRVHPDFLFNFLDQSYETLRNLGRGGNQPNLNSKIIKEFQIPLPPLDLQTRFAAMVANIEAQRRLAERQLEAAEAVFGGVLQGTFER